MSKIPLVYHLAPRHDCLPHLLPLRTIMFLESSLLFSQNFLISVYVTPTSNHCSLASCPFSALLQHSKIQPCALCCLSWWLLTVNLIQYCRIIYNWWLPSPSWKLPFLSFHVKILSCLFVVPHPFSSWIYQFLFYFFCVVSKGTVLGVLTSSAFSYCSLGH